MRNEEGHYTEREYNPRLEAYLGIYNLQQLYEYYQDDLWKKLKKWTKKNNFIIAIPLPKMYAGRYTQYPLSQALLNQEDLKKISLLFQNVGIKPEEYLSFEDFVILIKNSDRNIGLPNHYYKVIERLQEQEKEHLLYYQLFGFFNNEWDGSYLKEKKKDKRKNNHIQKNRTYLTIDNTSENLKILNDEYVCLHEYSLKNQYLFNTIKKYYNLFHQDMLFFIRDISYDEWIDCRNLEPNNEFIIICKIYSQAETFIHKLDANYTKFDNSYYSIFKVSLGNKSSKFFYWKPFFSKKLKNYTFENGLKLSRKNWMSGAGPSIRFFEKTKAWINGKKLSFKNNRLNFSCKDYEEGTYRLKVKDLPPEKFHIKKPKVVHHINLQGWQISEKESKWKTANEKYQISGLSTWFPVKLEKASVRTWAAALTQKSNKIKNSSVVVNAIKQSIYGI